MPRPSSWLSSEPSTVSAVGILRDFLTGRPQSVTRDLARAVDGPSFATTIDPATLYGVQSLDQAIEWWTAQGRVTRREAMAVPAVKRARDMIVGVVGATPLRLLDRNRRPVMDGWALLDQPEEDRPGLVTWSNVADDLIMSQHAFLRVTHLGWHGLPAGVVRLDPETASYRESLETQRTSTGGGTASTWTPDSQVIRVDSPNDGLLVAGARAIRALSFLELAALNAASGVPPQDYFTPADGVDPADDDDITAILDAWQAARQARTTAYVPAALNYHVNGWTPEQLPAERGPGNSHHRSGQAHRGGPGGPGRVHHVPDLPEQPGPPPCLPGLHVWSVYAGH